jgi:tetratricopeptide (TPR) repeat protein
MLNQDKVPLRCLRSALVIFLNLSLLVSLGAGDAFADETSSYEANVIKARELFESRQFQELTLLLEKYQTACEQDIRWEFAVADGLDVFYDTKPSYRILLDEWVQASPKSWVPLIARANYYVALGWKARGAESAGETSENQFRQMRDNFSVAVRDATAALRIKPRLWFAYDTLIRVNKSKGDQEAGILLVRKALENFPDSYIIRRQHLMSLTPRWGGSYAAMEQFAKEAAPYVPKNPILKTLPGFVFWDQARLIDRNERSQPSIELFEKALTYGENQDFLYDLAETYLRNQMHVKALRTVERAIALRPQLAQGYGLHAEIFSAMERWEDTQRELEKIEQISGSDSDAVAEARQGVSSRIVLQGHKEFRANNFTKAVGKYTLALQFFPKNAEAYCWRGVAHNSMGKLDVSLSDLQKAISLDPRLYDAYKGLDDLLIKQGRLDEIIEYWGRFLLLEPRNANAYLERSGTFIHKKELVSALKDAMRACTLRNFQGCQQIGYVVYIMIMERIM